MNPVPFSIPFEFNGKHYVCELTSIKKYSSNPQTFQVTLNSVYFGIITFTGETWESDTFKQGLVEKIGRLIHESITPAGN
ncbi:MAG TPA: hypothetical protein VNV85_08330 [Puia sp.]|nr:hypothetical protein [Puia sp.]